MLKSSFFFLVGQIFSPEDGGSTVLWKASRLLPVYQCTRCRIPEDSTSHNPRRENLKSHGVLLLETMCTTSLVATLCSVALSSEMSSTHWAHIHISVKLMFLSGHKSSLSLFQLSISFHFCTFLYPRLHTITEQCVTIWYSRFEVSEVSYFK
jgi:hypothetical protein